RQARCEAEAAARFAIVQRLDAQAITPEHDLARLAVRDRKREHTIEPLYEGWTPGVIRLEQHLGVTVREEPVTSSFELLAELDVVVDRAVVDDHQPQLGVDHRLPRLGAQVDDAEAPMSESDVIVGDRSVRVGTASEHALGHDVHRTKVGFFAVETQLTTN